MNTTYKQKTDTGAYNWVFIITYFSGTGLLLISNVRKTELGLSFLWAQSFGTLSCAHHWESVTTVI